MRFAPALTAALLVGCAPEPAGEQVVTPARPSPTPVASLALDPLTGRHGDLPGELRCAFESDERQSLLIAGANVGREARATALVSVGERDRLLPGTTTGGFGALERGGRFAGNALNVTVARGERQETGHEGSRFRATLTAEQGLARVSYDGWWTCGP